MNIKRFSGIIYLKYVPWDYSLGIGESFFKIHSGGILKFLKILGAAVRLSGNRGQIFFVRDTFIIYYITWMENSPEFHMEILGKLLYERRTSC